MGRTHHQRHVPGKSLRKRRFRDNEERGVSNFRRVPLRGRSHVTGSENTGATPEQRGPDCEEKRQISARLSF